MAKPYPVSRSLPAAALWAATLQMIVAAGRARDQADIIALATVLQVDPEEAVQLTLKAYGAEALEVMTKLEDVTHDAQALIPERPRD